MEEGGLLASSEFWVGLAFVGFFLLILYLGVHKQIAGLLDARIAKVRADLEQAKQLREEAEELLAQSQKKHRDALREAEAIVSHATEEAARIQGKAARDLADTIARRRAQALAKIERAEAEAVQEVRNLAVSAAVAATRDTLAADLSGDKAAALINQAVSELPRKLA
jgi:F-type H+-transporting ATPase subunit b